MSWFHGHGHSRQDSQRLRSTWMDVLRISQNIVKYGSAVPWKSGETNSDKQHWPFAVTLPMFGRFGRASYGILYAILHFHGGK